MIKKHIPFVFFLLMSLLATSEAFAEFGPWAHLYFKEGGLLHCKEEVTCIAPGREDIEALKKDWESSETARLKRIEYLGALANQASEKILELGQTALADNENSNFGNLYMEYGSLLQESASTIKMDSLRLWVSKESPLFSKIIELESLLTEWQNQIDEQEDQDVKEGLELLKNEKYKEWLRSEELQSTLEEMTKIQLQYFPKEVTGESETSLIDGLMKLAIPMTEFMDASDCTPGIQTRLKMSLGNLQFSNAHREKGDWDPIKDQAFVRFLTDGGGFGKKLKVNCQKAKLLQKVRVRYERNHELLIRYRVKSENNGESYYVLPSRADLIKELKESL
ncbi:MAG: hypothetical protein NXH75_05375 [Halobacteriovoraceae bacterium]|nr:hypothetical protein [Halobacteriovoraceae bacterium]